MDLKTGNLLWPALSSSRGFARLDNDIRCEVAVIGAGISGALVASALADEGIDTVVIDRRQPAEGSTSASTAMVLYEIDVPLTDLACKVGDEHAQRAYRAARRALDDLAQIVRSHDIDCDLHPRNSLYLATKHSDMDWFADEARARKQIGIEAELLGHDDLKERFNLDRPGAIVSAAAAMEVDPYRLTLSLIDCAIARGGRVFGQTDVEVDSCEDQKIILQSEHGPRVECKKLVIATGYETPELFERVRKLCSLKSTYALASQQLETPPWPGSNMIWESADPYLYARLANGRVVLGGEDEPIIDPERRDALIDQKVKRLLEKFARLCPDVRLDPEFVWAGTFAQTADGLPFIGPTKGWPDCHFALGYGGNGITFSVLASQIIRDSLVGRANADSALFRFDR